MSTYQSTLDYLFAQLPQYQKIGGKAYKANLNNITDICELLGNPHLAIKTVHVAGSNGKGSVSHMLASILQEAGYKVGLYTSPHLKDFRERIKINGIDISEEEVVDFVSEYKEILTDVNPSFFEWTVGLAFHYFEKKKTDINIIETGLGGRLDSTNIITPEVSVITNISLEHTVILGNTIELITKEKAGIIKKGIPVVIGKTQKETKPIFEEIAKNLNSPIHFADKEKSKEYKLDLVGEIQQENAQTTVKTINVLESRGFHISEKNIEEGLANVIGNTRLLGRFQIVSKNPTIVYDTAHNPDGIKKVVSEIGKLLPNKLHVVIGIASDKSHQKILEPFPKGTAFYFCSSSNERVLKGGELTKIASELGIKGNTFNSVQEGLNEAKSNAIDSDLIVVTGSNFVVADII